jgi:sugar/nucleoside kinase (ribokinase family)
VGKIIIDEYGQDQSEAAVSVGGGGPQAAFGAAAALAVLSGDEQDTPSPQPVTLIGPVGEDDWTEREETALRETLGNAVSGIRLFKGKSLRTPRIQLWHDDNQDIQWRPLNDSFGPLGAGGLWRFPRARDFLDVVGDSEAVTCHVIVEGGANSPGDGEDSVFLLDPNVQERIKFIGVEPVVFPSEDIGRVSGSDVQSCTSRLDRTSLDFVSPDNHLFQEVPLTIWKGIEVGVRNGPKGSLVIERGGKRIRIPAATLATPDGEPINPTGAGNSYAAAFTTCRGSGASIVDSACIAGAVGAVFCEYEHMPPWSAPVLCRIREAANEIGNRVVEEIAG